MGRYERCREYDAFGNQPVDAVNKNLLAGDVYLYDIDIHVVTDRLGSSTEYSKDGGD